MIDKLTSYLNRKPEIVFEWNDSQSEAQGWVVINSLRGGAAGGGTRMRPGLSLDEVVALAKVMEVKFTVSGPAIGGAKSGINFDPRDPRKNEVLDRWYKAVFPLLKSYYGTGGDLNIDELKEVIPITEELGLWHPQEGIVNGHFEYAKGEKVHAIGQLRFGVSKIVENENYTPSLGHKYAVADMITGYGVAESIKHYYDIFKGQTLDGKKAIIQGWGNVASAAAYYLAQDGTRIVGIIDKHGGVMNEKGFSFEEVKEMFINKKGNSLHVTNMLNFEEIDKKIWEMKADIFIPGAASRLVSKSNMEKLVKNGINVVSCGANVPFVDDEFLFGHTAKYVDERVSLIPDFIANCGMARTFAYLMSEVREISDNNIFEDVSCVIHSALKEIYNNNPEQTHIMERGLGIALDKIR